MVIKLSSSYRCPILSSIPSSDDLSRFKRGVIHCISAVEISSWSPCRSSRKARHKMFLTVSRNSHALVCNPAPFLGCNSFCWLCIIASVDQLYAYSYQPQPNYTSNNGWRLYDPLHEYERMGVGTKNDNWRFTTINRDYTVSIFGSWEGKENQSLTHHDVV